MCRKLAETVVKKYELWKDIVFRHGPEKLKEFPASNLDFIYSMIGIRLCNHLNGTSGNSYLVALQSAVAQQQEWHFWRVEW